MDIRRILFRYSADKFRKYSRAYIHQEDIVSLVKKFP